MRMIVDTDELYEFFTNLMVPLHDDFVYVIYMVARKKWDNSLARSEEMLYRQILTEYGFDRFYRLLLRFDVPPETFIDANNRIISRKAMGVYIDLTPKSVIKGMTSYFKEFISDVVNSRYDVNALNRLKRFNSLSFGAIHRSNGIRKKYRIIDIDTKDDTVYKVADILDDNGIPIYWVTETHGGYHIFIENGVWMRTFNEFVVNELRGMESVEILNHNQTPVCGTLQGGFVVRRVEL